MKKLIATVAVAGMMLIGAPMTFAQGAGAAAGTGAGAGAGTAAGVSTAAMVAAGVVAVAGIAAVAAASDDSTTTVATHDHGGTVGSHAASINHSGSTH